MFESVHSESMIAGRGRRKRKGKEREGKVSFL